jgi:hypothetical protein
MSTNHFNHFSHFGKAYLVMLIIYFKSHLCQKQLVCYDYNQFCPLSSVIKNMTKLNIKD